MALSYPVGFLTSTKVPKHVLETSKQKAQKVPLRYRAGVAPAWLRKEGDEQKLLRSRTRRALKRLMIPKTRLSQPREKVAASTVACPPPLVDTSKLVVPDADVADASSSEDEDAIAQRRARIRARLQSREEKVRKEDRVEASEEEEEEEEESSSEESEEDLYAHRVLYKPVFITKKSRATIREREEHEAKAELEEKEKEERDRERRMQSERLVLETLAREDAAKELAKKKEEEEMPPTDTDEDEVETEINRWRVRELQRLKRDQMERDRWEAEEAALAVRRLMTDEQIEEDNKEKGLKIKPERSQMKFLQKYYHKGAFYQDKNDGVYQRDFNQAVGLDRDVDRTALPSVLQVKNFGMKSRTKYTHLVDQDTTRFQENPWLDGEKLIGWKRPLAGTGGVDRPAKRKRR